MTALMKLTLDPSPGAILRIVGLAERRGYDPLQLTADHDQGTLTMTMTVKAERPIGILVSQLHKLYGMHSVEVLS